MTSKRDPLPSNISWIIIKALGHITRYANRGTIAKTSIDYNSVLCSVPEVRTPISIYILLYWDPDDATLK